MAPENATQTQVTQTQVNVTSNNQSKAHVVVGVDGSESSKTALRWAAKLAPALDASIEAITAWEYPMMLGWEGGIPDWWRPDEDSTKILQETLDEVFGSAKPAGMIQGIRQGHPTTVLLEASKNASMLILGSRGHGGFVGLLLGSVSSTCAEHAKCPVLVVHGE